MHFHGAYGVHIIYESTFTLAMANSGMNPLIYAWKNTNFRKAFLCVLRCRSPNGPGNKGSFITNHVPSKKNSTVEGVCNGVEDGFCDGVELRSGRQKDGDAVTQCSAVTECTMTDSLPRRAWNSRGFRAEERIVLS